MHKAWVMDHSLHVFCTNTTNDSHYYYCFTKEGSFMANSRPQKGRAPTELLLFKRLKEAYPDEEITFNAKLATGIKHPETGMPLQIDASIFRLNMHFEFQDPYHFTSSVQQVGRPRSEIKMLDEYKKEQITKRGEILVQIPPWWNGVLDSLIATIQSKRPGCFPNYTPSSPPISDTVPNDFFEYYTLPHVGVLMRPIDFSPRYFATSRDWCVGVKKDGVRFLWDPIEQGLYHLVSIENQINRFPDEFKKLMPNRFIEGEAWFGVGTFNEATKLKGSSTVPVKWEDLRLVVFDIPPEQGASDATSFSDRHAELLKIIPYDHPFLVVPMRVQVTGQNQLTALNKLVIAGGHEGLMLMKTHAPYEQGHSASVLKIKPKREVDAKVISCEDKFVVLELLDETTFRTPHPEIKLQLKPGDVVSYTFKRFVNGTVLPYKPQITRLRKDVDWEKEKAGVFPLARNGINYTERWDKDIDTARTWLIQYAAFRNFNPFIAADWYRTTLKDVLETPGAYNMLKWFNGSLVTALVESFPDIGIDKSKFSKVPRNYWTDINNIRSVFDDFAKQKEFDPLVALNWYNITRTDLMALVKKSVVARFGSFTEALKKVYPEVIFDVSKFIKVPQHHWKDFNNIRSTFDEFAKLKGFDPMVANNWYGIARRALADFVKRGTLDQFNGSISKALKAAYPEISFDGAKFAKTPLRHWENPNNIRIWFDNFAKQKGFDPLVANNWYGIQTRRDLVALVKRGVLNQFSGSLSKALEATYPEVTFDEHKFSKVSRNYWANINNVRSIFDDFAKQKGFDPLVATNWYNITSNDLLKRSALYRFGGSISKSLKTVYPEISFDGSKFVKTPQNHWKDAKNVRKWFEQFAKLKGFDPLVADKWNEVLNREIRAMKGGRGIQAAFGEDWKRALLESFPNIGINKQVEV